MCCSSRVEERDSFVAASSRNPLMHAGFSCLEDGQMFGGLAMLKGGSGLISADIM